MDKTIIDMLQEIQNAVNKPLYDDLTPYLTGIRDLLNLINNVEYAPANEVYEHIMEQCSKVSIN